MHTSQEPKHRKKEAIEIEKAVKGNEQEKEGAEAEREMIAAPSHWPSD